MTSLVWFRDDLRTVDHPALRAAAERGEGVVALYVLDEESEGIRPLGGAARWWLHHSLVALRTRLDDLGIPLVLRCGAAFDVVRDVVAQIEPGLVVWNRRYGGPERDVDTAVKTWLGEHDVEAHSHAAHLLFEPWTVRTGEGTPYRVFTPFWRACREMPEPHEPLPEPAAVTHATSVPAGDDLDDWGLLPTTPDWSGGIAQAWTPGQASAQALLEEFLDDGVSHYVDERDQPAKSVGSRLSPHLRWGEISPNTVWHAAQAHRNEGHDGDSAGGIESFLSELGWREFAWHTLYEHPDLAEVNLNRKFDAFPWPPLDSDALVAWQKGETGIPIVDAGMRELWETGTMHNRVRMVVASFLTKNLLIDWRLGEEWFWDTLVDADAASNPFNWQWVAGCGADAAPYFRIFNPVTQQEKFDPDGRYVHRWQADDGRSPIVDLKTSREAALAAYKHVKG